MMLKYLTRSLLGIIVAIFLLLPAVHAESTHSQVWIYDRNGKLLKHYTHAKNKKKVHEINVAVGDAGGTAEKSANFYPKKPKNVPVKYTYELTDYHQKSKAVIYANREMYVHAHGIVVKVKLNRHQYRVLTDVD